MSAHTAAPSAAAVAVAVLLVLAGGVPLPVAAAEPVTVERVGLSGPAVVGGGDRPSIAGWRAMNVTASVATGTDAYEVCVDVTGADGSTALGCRRLAGTNATENVTVAVDGIPGNVTGNRELVVSVRPAGSDNATSDALATARRAVRLLAATGDVDDDGLGNRRELEVGTDPDAADTDGDGLDDGPEVNTYETDPTSTDTDGDGLSDGVEVNDQGSNPTEPDTDGDGLDDGPEVATHGTDPTSTDTDGDGLDDGAEVEQHGTNPTEPDTDGDGLDDGAEVNVHGTDPTSTDTDGDGLDDGAEVEQHGTNPTEPDTDGDGLDDGAEVNVHGTDPTRADTDGDGQSDGVEVERGSDPVAEGDGNGAGPVQLPDVGVGLTVVVALLVGVSIAFGAVFVHRRHGLPWPGHDGDGTDATTTTAAGEERSTDATGPGPEVTEAMTDEERIHSLIDDRGGRVRQSTIVEETGWSKSKVSRVLSRMADEGAVEKITIGRENLIAHPDEVPDGATSPFDPADSE